MKNCRPSLRDALSIKSGAPAPDDRFGDVDDALASNDEGRCGILVRVSQKFRDEVKHAALARRMTVQALVLEAITESLKKPNVPAGMK